MNTYKIEIKYGLIFVVMSLLWILLEKMTGLHSESIHLHTTYTNFIAIPATAIYVFALLEKRKKDLQGSMTWLQGFKSGMIISLVVMVLSPITQMITFWLITPEFFPNVIKYAVNSRYMTQAEAENYFTLSNYMVQGLIGAPIMGAFTSALVAIFIMKKPVSTV
ncbi:MAG: DUF4199 domain-containing protein [Cytophagales bacterium]|nr:MAG: DUF4199 domain-containing protein [Cytophagales bacterium]